MNTRGHILVINTGSTSTKLAIYAFDLDAKSLTLHRQVSLDHHQDGLSDTASIMEQLDLRLNTVQQFLDKEAVTIALIMARAAPLRPLEGGIYGVDSSMLEAIRSCQYASHASNLAALIGDKIGTNLSVPVYIADPITTDEFEPLARISGVPGIERKSRSHTLNIKASCRKICQEQKLDFFHSQWVICHMGGGISVAALKNGRIVDVNDALLGMGPFSPERAGALPVSGILNMVYDENLNREAVEKLFSTSSGLKGYLGTADLIVVEDRIQAGDAEAALIYSAMVYQISKEIAAMASVFAFELDGILLTGGMAHSNHLCDAISTRVESLAPIHIEPGENELKALAEAGFRVLLNEESPKVYGPSNA